MASRRICREAVFINGKLHSRFDKTHRGMRARTKQKFVAKAAAPGARVPQANSLPWRGNPVRRRRARGTGLEIFSARDGHRHIGSTRRRTDRAYL